MTLRRIDGKSAGVVFEWDEEDGNFALGLGMLGEAGRGRGREKAYGNLEALQSMVETADIGWVDLEVSEHYKRVCGMVGLVLVWRGTTDEAEDSRRVAEFVAYALGFEGELEV